MNGPLSVLRVLETPPRTLLGVTLFGLTLVLGGCNVFGDIAPTPATVDALVSDAESALATGNAARAVRLFERAYERDSTDVRVRIGLGNSLYADRGVDVFTLRRAAEHLVGASADSAAAARASVQEEAVCTAGERPDVGSESYDTVPLDAAPLQRVTEHASVVERVWRLVVSGVLQRQPDAFASAEPAVRRKGLLVGAVTAVTQQAIDVRSVFRDTGSALFLDRSVPSGRALVACASTEEDLTQNHRALCRLGAAAQQGRQWLQARTGTTEEDRGAVLSDRLRTLDDAVRARIDCS